MHECQHDHRTPQSTHLNLGNNQEVGSYERETHIHASSTSSSSSSSWGSSHSSSHSSSGSCSGGNIKAVVTSRV